MVEKIPTGEEMAELLGPEQYEVWVELCACIEEKYEMEQIWSEGHKGWKYECKYRKGGKTLCSLNARKDRMGFQVIFGKAEREKFEAARETFPVPIQMSYDKAQTFHDGKWVMFEPEDTEFLLDYMRLLLIKRRPNRK